MANEKKSAGRGATPGSAAHQATGSPTEAAANAQCVAALLPEMGNQAGVAR